MKERVGRFSCFVVSMDLGNGELGWIVHLASIYSFPVYTMVYKSHPRADSERLRIPLSHFQAFNPRRLEWPARQCWKVQICQSKLSPVSTKNMPQPSQEPCHPTPWKFWDLWPCQCLRRSHQHVISNPLPMKAAKPQCQQVTYKAAGKDPLRNSSARCYPPTSRARHCYLGIVITAVYSYHGYYCTCWIKNVSSRGVQLRERGTYERQTIQWFSSSILQ